MRKYGLRGLSLPDQRDEDYAFSCLLSAQAPVDIPPVKYLICPPVADQGDLGSCVFFALCYALEAMQLTTHDQIPINPSQLWAYYRYRELYGDVCRDDGAFIREAIKVFQSDGVPLEDDWPYQLSNWNKKPPQRAYTQAWENRILSYHAIYTRDEMLSCLASGYGFVGGITVYESFESPEVERTGIVPIPGRGEKVLGGHGLFFGAGYNLHEDMIGFVNSYGPSWGQDGKGWIPIDYLTNPRLAGDFWTIRS